MIHPAFYRKENLSALYLDQKVPHYPIKRRSKVVGQYPYVIKFGEDLLSIAKKIFGDSYPFYWTYIAEINSSRHPDSWLVGEVIQLPKIVVLESEKKLTNFTDAEITSTKI